MSQPQFGNYNNVKKIQRAVVRNQLHSLPALASAWSGLQQVIYGHSSSSASVMKLVQFNRRQEHVAPETQLSENMLCALLIREGNSAARRWLQLPSQESVRKCRQTCWCLTLMTGKKIIELVVCEKGIKFNLVQKLEIYIHKTFQVLLQNTSISVSIFIYMK